MVRLVEAYSLNAWPAAQTIVYEGWLMRLNQGYTKRANCMCPMYGHWNDEQLSTIVQYGESVYKALNLPAVVKVTPIAPGILDTLLEARGYEKVDPSLVMTLHSLEELSIPSVATVDMDYCIQDDWLHTYASFTNLSSQHLPAAQRLLQAIPFKKAFMRLRQDGHIVACGLAVIEGETVGLYDVAVHPEHRRQGCGEQLVLHLLHWARAEGAARSYLQVVQGNKAANRLYRKFGYREMYPYWYRVKSLE